MVVLVFEDADSGDGCGSLFGVAIALLFVIGGAFLFWFSPKLGHSAAEARLPMAAICCAITTVTYLLMRRKDGKVSLLSIIKTATLISVAILFIYAMFFDSSSAHASIYDKVLVFIFGPFLLAGICGTPTAICGLVVYIVDAAFSSESRR